MLKHGHVKLDNSSDEADESAYEGNNDVDDLDPFSDLED